jgi:hypothetical protein
MSPLIADGESERSEQFTPGNVDAFTARFAAAGVHGREAGKSIRDATVRANFRGDFTGQSHARQGKDGFRLRNRPNDHAAFVAGNMRFFISVHDHQTSATIRVAMIHVS